MFPDIDGLALQLGWRYWVMDEREDIPDSSNSSLARKKRALMKKD
jgi:hypothetical protein